MLVEIVFIGTFGYSCILPLNSYRAYISVYVCVCVYLRVCLGGDQVSAWIEEVGESQLKSLEVLEDSLKQQLVKQSQFKDFHSTAYVRLLRFTCFETMGQKQRLPAQP